jgi:hypothetical protein
VTATVGIRIMTFLLTGSARRHDGEQIATTHSTRLASGVLF